MIWIGIKKDVAVIAIEKEYGAIEDVASQEADPAKVGAVVEGIDQDLGIGIDLPNRTKDRGQKKEEDEKGAGRA